MSALPYYVIYLLPASFVAGTWLGGAWPLMTPALVFGLIPVLDQLLGLDRRDPDAEQAPSPLYDLALRLWVPVQLGVIALGLYRATHGATLAEAAVLVLALGILCGGGGINIAHELMHRKAKGDRALAEILMGSVTYTWFCVEHVHGHHRNVATAADPATSRLGESLYRFLPRVLVGSFASFWRIEREHARRRGIPWWSWRDRRTRYLVELTVVYGVLAAIGWQAVLFFATQSLVAVLLLEVINYVEHYGLQRVEVAPGRYERVRPEHSWNSNHRLTGWFLFNLPRHADHHAWASRPYWMLRAWPDAPQLPVGYPTMVLMALVPPLWFRVMNPRAISLSRAVQPSRA